MRLELNVEHIHHQAEHSTNGQQQHGGGQARRQYRSATTPTTQPASPSPRARRSTFTNHDQTAHTATSQQLGFDTGTINPGQSATVTLDKPGTYTYYCQFHPFMHGTIIVERRPSTTR